MAATDILLTSAATHNPTNSYTAGVPEDEQTKVSNFLTIQSLANFAAMTGAITVAWKALQAADDLFKSRWTPFLLALAWLAASLAVTVQAQKGSTPNASGNLSWGFWLSAVVIGVLNALVLFASVVGLS